MRVYVMRFVDRDSLRAAYEILTESERVTTCSIEQQSGRLRFLASVRAADALVRRIYLRGGLAWCTRHEVVGQRTQP